MDYRISVSDDGRYLICRVQGRITRPTALAFTRELDRLSRERGIKRFLTDVREASNDLGVLHNYLFANEVMPELELQRDVRSAILTRPDDKTHDFVETALRNAGYPVRLFRDEAAAIAWLEG